MFHLHRGGRVSKTVALVGSALNLKPFFYVNIDGGLTTDGNMRGRKKALRTLVDRMKNTLSADTDFSLPAGIAHGNCYEDALAVAELIKQETPFTEVIIGDLNPSIGTHAGPNTLGVFYYGQKKAAAK